jgi:hypothetical protein
MPVMIKQTILKPTEVALAHAWVALVREEEQRLARQRC